MSAGLVIGILLLPYAILACPLLWPTLRSRGSAIRWLLRIAPAAMALLLGAGDILNRLDEAFGFDARLFLIGVVVTVALNVVAWVRPVQRRIGTWLSAAIEAIRVDLREPVALETRASRAWSAFLFVAFASLFYVVFTTYRVFNYQLKFEVFGFLDMVATAAAETELAEVTSGERCVNSRVYRLMTRIFFPFAASASLETYFHICMVLVMCIFAIRWAMQRGWPPWLLFSSHLFYLAVSINPDHEFNRTADFEVAFALLFLVSFVLILRAKMTVGWLWLLGFFNGVAFLQKELALLGVALVAFRLADSGLPRRRILALIASASAGFLPSSLVYGLPLIRCQVAEGPYHLPFLWYRGTLLQTQWTQFDVMTAIDGGKSFTITEMVLGRLSFQTLGEVVAGGAAQFGLFTLLGVFPLAYMVANFQRDHLRTIAMYLALGFVLYGVTHWKGGDSSDPLYTMLPFGYVFSVPYLIRLVSGTLAVIRSGFRFSVRFLYIPGLLALNLWFLAQQVGPLARTAADLRHLSGLSPRGLTYSVEPSGKEAELRDLLFRLRDEGQLGRWLFLGACLPPEVPRSIVHSELDRHLALLDIRDEILRAVREMDVPWIRQAFRSMTYLLSYELDGVSRLYVLACMHDARPTRPYEPFAYPGPWLGGCVDVLFSDPNEMGIVLFAFNLDRCQRYLPDYLQDGRLRFGRFPVLGDPSGP